MSITAKWKPTTKFYKKNVGLKRQKVIYSLQDFDKSSIFVMCSTKNKNTN